jgi:probable rRNA maturation factor
MALIFDSLPDFWAQRSKHWAIWLQEVAASEGKRLGDFNYRFHTDDELLELNRRFLDHDTYTDIITFDRTRGSRISADVAVSWERVLDNASRLGTELGDEVDRVVLHAVLHACGYADKSPEEEIKMRALENHYLAVRPLVLLHVEQ